MRVLHHVFGASCSAFLAAFLFSAAALSQSTIHVPADQPTIQGGINAAKAGDTVLIAPGTYYENIDFMGKAITVTSSDGAAKTILDGGMGATEAVIMKHSEGRNSILNGLTIQHGGVEIYYGAMGGLFLNGVSPTITNNVITNNHCYGIWSSGSSPLIQNNEIDNVLDANGNCSFAGGTAIWLDGSLTAVQPAVIGNILQNNTHSGEEDAGGNGGAGVAAWTSNAVIENNIIRNNFTHGFGGGILLEDSSGLIVQNLIYNNMAGGAGGAIATDGYLGAPTAYIANNTIANNTYGGGGGESDDYPISQLALGYFTGLGPSTVLVNNIIAGNTSVESVVCGSYFGGKTGNLILADHNLFFNSGGAVFKYCTDPTGTYGNITADPLFVNAAGGDFHLQPGSPAIDAGNNSALAFLSGNTVSTPVQLTQDLDGKPRVADATGQGVARIDMGAYETAGVQNANATMLLLMPSGFNVAAGSNLTLTAKAFSAAGIPPGSTTFFQDGNSIGAVMLNAAGSAVQSANVTPGVHRFVATYPGQGVFPAGVSVETLVQVGNYGVTLTVTSSQNPSVVGQPVTFNVKIGSADTNQLGPVVLTDNYNALTTLTPDANGNASFTTSSLAVGSHFITASYSGDSTHNSATSSVSQSVLSGLPSTITVTSSPNPSVVGQTVTFAATVTTAASSGVATGTVSFVDAATNMLLGAAILAPSGASSATASVGVSSLAVGYHTVTATYLPAATFASSSASVQQQVTAGIATTLTLGCPATAFPDQVLSVQVLLQAASGSASGTVALTAAGANTVTSAIASAPLTLAFGPLAIGSRLLTATLTPAAGYAPSTATCQVTVAGHGSSTTLTAAPGTAPVGQPITLSAQVASSGATLPTGSVTFSTVLQGQLATVALSAGGAASTQVTSLMAGSQQVNATYSGDSNTASSTGSATVTVTKLATNTTLTLPALHIPAYSQQAVGASVAPTTPYTGAYAGTVSFTASGAALGQGTLNASGTASAGFSSLGAGSYSVVAAYLGSSTFLPSSSPPQVLIVDPAVTTLTLTASPSPAVQGQTVTVLATLAAAGATLAPTGQVQIFDGAALLSTQAVGPGGTVTLSTSTFAPGTHLLSAVYTPGSNNFTSATATTTELVQLQDFSITAGSPTLTIATEHHATLPLQLASIGSFQGPVQLSCDPLPPVASCTFANASPQLAPNGTASTSVVLDTDAVLGFKAGNDGLPRAPLVFAALLPAALLLLRRRRRIELALFAGLLGVMAMGVSGCSGKYPAHTPPGTYTVVVRASSGAQTHTAAVTLTVTD
jgi:parallel beta-helix repeat protein